MLSPAEPLFALHYTDIDGQEVPLSRYAGEVLLLVNVASRCGFTEQYAALQALYSQHAAAGLNIIGFPCNQFAGQESGDDHEVKTFCQTRFGVTFPLAAKVEVRGPGAHPIFVALCNALPGLLGTRGVKWNFTKFLVGRDGVPIRRYGPRTTPAELAPDVVVALQQPI